jgi:hypothetical protein
VRLDPGGEAFTLLMVGCNVDFVGLSKYAARDEFSFFQRRSDHLNCRRKGR